MNSVAELTLGAYLERLASGDAAPGGGAVAALTGAQAAALLSMAQAISSKNKSASATLVGCGELEGVRHRLLALATQDGEAFAQVLAAYQLPKSTSDEQRARSVAVENALHFATEVPLEVMSEVAALWPAIETTVASVKASVVSDVAIAVELWAAALAAARHNVRINLRHVRDESFCRNAETLCSTLLAGHGERRDAVLRSLERAD
jgi:methenyltetrahydrofolate cyclohydrolase